jgi:Transposase DDE domain
MIEGFSYFAKQLLSIGGFQITHLPTKAYRQLLTAFQDMVDHDVVMIKPLLKLVKKLPGRLILDDTTNPKYGLKRWSRKMKIIGTSGYAHGYKVLLFLWECELGRIPVGFALWHQESKPVNELVLIGLNLLRRRFKLKPRAVVADAAFCTDKLLKRLQGYGWACVMRFKSNRKLGTTRVDKLIARGYGSEQGHLKNGVKVKVFRRKNRFFVCNRMTWTMQDAVSVYTKRWKIEEVFRVLKQCLQLKGCQQHSMKAQTIYITVCLMLFAGLELYSGQSVYKTAQQVISQQLPIENLLNNRIFRAF